MEVTKIMSLLCTDDFVKSIRFYKYVLDGSKHHCGQCFRYSGFVFSENDSRIPELPIHPNCKCTLVEVDQEEYLKQKEFKFGKMSHETWFNQSKDARHLWCNVFRDKFGSAIDKYAQQYNIPKQLLAGIVANEMLDWKSPDGTQFDGIRGGGVGYAQIAIKTARQHGTTGTDSIIRKQLNPCEGSIAIAAKILKNYLAEYKESVENGKIGPGYEKSDLYCAAKPHILQQENLVDLQVPAWLLNSMCAIWNSGIELIYAKDPIGDNNYRNANNHGMNSTVLLDYLPKLVNE